MRYVVYGTGAVGGVIGGQLHLSGFPTTLVARGRHLDLLRENGLVLDTAESRLTVRAPAVSSADAVNWAADSVVLLTVKSHQTAAALADIAVHAPDDVPVVSVQNGVSNEPAILRHFQHTYSVCVMLPAVHVEPGVVVQQCWPTPGILDVGRYPGGVDGFTERLSADLTQAGFSSRPQPDIMARKYRKLVVNLANGVAAACRPGGDAFDELVRRARDEGEAVIAAAGIPIISAAEDADRRGEILQRRSGTRGAQGGSTWQSITRATGNTEIDHLAGEVVLLGRLHGVPTPVNEAIRRAIVRIASERRPAADLSASELLATIRSPS